MWHTFYDTMSYRFQSRTNVRIRNLSISRIHPYINAEHWASHHPIETSTYFHSIPFPISMTTMNSQYDKRQYPRIHEDISLQIVRFVYTNHGQSHCVVRRTYFINVDPSFATNNNLKHPLNIAKRRRKHTQSLCDKGTMEKIYIIIIMNGYNFCEYNLTKYLTFLSRKKNDSVSIVLQESSLQSL